MPLNFTQMSVWKLRRAVAVVYPSLNITNHQSLSKKKSEAYEKNFILKPADPDIISRKLCGGRVSSRSKVLFIVSAKVYARDEKGRRPNMDAQKINIKN